MNALKNFDEMVELAQQASAPADARELLETTLRNLPKRQPERMQAHDAADAGDHTAHKTRVLRPRWRKAGYAVAGVAACAALTLCLAGGPFGLGGGSEGSDKTSASTMQSDVVGNMFSVQQAYGIELAPGQKSDGSVLAMAAQAVGEIGEDGCFTALTFKIEGENIATVRASVSKGELYRVTHSEMSKADFDEKWPNGHTDNSEGRVHMTYWDDDEGPINDDFCEAVGSSVEDAYNPDIAYGFYQPASMVEDFMSAVDDDLKGPFWNLVDSFDSAVLDIAVTYTDGSTESKSYDLKAGKLKVQFTEEGEGFNLLPEFTDGEDGPFVYGLLATQRS